MKKMYCCIVALLLVAVSVNADFVTFSEDWEGYTPANLNATGLYDLDDANWSGNGYQYGTISYKGSVAVTGDATNKALSFQKEANHNVDMSYAILSQSVRGGVFRDSVFRVTQDVYINSMTAGLCDQTPSGQISFNAYRSYLKNTEGGYIGAVGFAANARNLANRQIVWFDGDGWHTYSNGAYGAWGSNEWLGIEQIVDEVNGTWGFSITNESGDELFSADNLGFASGAGQLGNAWLYMESAGKNDGFNISVDNLEVSSIPEPASIALLGLGVAGLLRKKK